MSRIFGDVRTYSRALSATEIKQLYREKYLKTGMGKRFLKNRLKRFLSLTA